MKKDRDFHNSNALVASATLDIIDHGNISQEELDSVLISAAKLILRVAVAEEHNCDSNSDLPDFDALDACRFCDFSVDKLTEALTTKALDVFQSTLEADEENGYITDYRKYWEGA